MTTSSIAKKLPQPNPRGYNHSRKREIFHDILPIMKGDAAIAIPLPYICHQQHHFSLNHRNNLFMFKQLKM